MKSLLCLKPSLLASHITWNKIPYHGLENSAWCGPSLHLNDTPPPLLHSAPMSSLNTPNILSLQVLGTGCFLSLKDSPPRHSQDLFPCFLPDPLQEGPPTNQHIFVCLLYWPALSTTSNLLYFSLMCILLLDIMYVRMFAYYLDYLSWMTAPKKAEIFLFLAHSSATEHKIVDKQ